MRQQINLYQAELFKEKKELWSLQNAVALWALGALFVGLVYFKGSVSLGKELKQQEAVKQQLEQVNQQNLLIQQQFPGRASIAKLRAELQALEQNLEYKKNIIDTLSEKTSSNLTGFSRFLEGFGRNTITGIWLSKIQISRGGEAFQLNGQTHRAESVFQLVQQLQESSEFENTIFHSFSLNREKERPKPGELADELLYAKLIDFVVSTEKDLEVSLEGDE